MESEQQGRKLGCLCVSQQVTKTHFPSVLKLNERLLDTSAHFKPKELLVCPQNPIVMKKGTIWCVFL